MSRIIVKNLPPHVTEEKLRSHFSKVSGSTAAVTDVKLMKNHRGKFRGFGFIGYKSEDDAREAVKFFNSSFIGTSRISVEQAKVLGDSSLVPSSEKKEQRKDAARKRELKEEELVSRKRQKNDRDSKKASQPVEVEDDKFKEFLGVMNAGRAKRIWDNDDILPANSEAAATAKPATDPIPAPVIPEGESDDEYVEVAKPKDADSDEEEMMPLSDFSKKDAEGVSEEGSEQYDNEDKDEEKETESAPVSDFEWLQMHRKRIPERQEEEPDHDEKAGNDKVQEEPVQEKQQETEPAQPSEHELQVQQVMSSKRLFVRNLLYTTTEDELRQLFAPFGDLEEVHLVVDAKTAKSKGLAYVQYNNADDAVSAFEKLDGQIFQGRLLHLIPAKPKRTNHLDEFDLKDLPLKKQKELKKKFAAARQQFSWNSLYLNEDAVRETVANKLGISKSQLINAESSDAAVQQALAEASVINSVRQYFESKGVDLLSFNKKERSDRVILAKNLPYGTSSEELADMFGQYGEVSKLLMPPDGGIAIIVFKTDPQGRAAFTKLAFRRIKTSILYLEKGPKGLLEETSVDTASTDDTVTGSGEKVKEVGPSAKELLLEPKDKEEEDGSAEAGVHTSVFVKNLNFSTTSADLNKLFRSLDGFLVAHVRTKADAKDPNKKLSMGFGFADFSSRRAAETAIEALDGYVLDGHKLQLKISTRESSDTSSVAVPKKKSSKILIKNIPFETTKKDVRQLFGTFGQLRAVRVPKKFDKAARGFAFAEFVTAKDAENAMKALQGTHLLGRRLVMEFAHNDATDAEEEISRMEAKVRKQVTNETLAGLRLSGKRRMDLEEDE
uniref:Multiple RNA-binding domain-containing protein 1 n=1 Tax=Blastobotrys adeninivorans TaxID=409370 RepID=A0A060T6X4_BLAAD